LIARAVDLEGTRLRAVLRLAEAVQAASAMPSTPLLCDPRGGISRARNGFGILADITLDMVSNRLKYNG
jgi:hypothetical protein